MSEDKISDALVKIANEAQQDFFDEHKLSEFFCSGHYHEESMRAALAAAIPHLHPQPAELAEQQVGEVQGDARAQFEAWADDQGFKLDRTVQGDDYQDLRTQGPWEAWQAALAARQPGAQGTRQDHLLDRRNRLMNSYGNGDREDAAVDAQIAQVDAELAQIDQRDAAPGVE